MTEHKFTDEEVIKALEHCGSRYAGDTHQRCNTCPMNEVSIENSCFDTLLHDLSLDLINRQIAELKKLKAFKRYFDSLYGTGLEIAKWHENGALEPFDNFYDAAIEEYENPTEEEG